MIYSDVAKYISNNQLFNESDKIIVGVSGGADSVALLDILVNLGYECIVAHCNFHLRSEESNRDASFVKELCKTYNVKEQSIDFDTEKYAQTHSCSIEMAARELRYNWFESLRQKYNAQVIAVAHHQDDSVETILLNLIRGTGIRGLTGISAKNGYVVRPLLCLNRDRILKYLADKHLSFVEDSTNKEDIYTRNKIRLNIIPLLETINPSTKNSISQTGDYLSQVQNIYFKYIEQAKKEIVTDNKINISKLLSYNESKAVLFEILSSYGFNTTVVSEVFNALEGISGKLFYSDTYRLLKDREYLVIDRKKPESDSEIIKIAESDTFLEYPIVLRIEIVKNNSDFKIDKNPHILYLDKSKITYPISIRRWKQGDWFVPLGLKGKKKISDYFSDQKFSLFEKENTWLLCSDENILWVVGKRSDDRYKITETTTEIVKISLEQ